MSTSSESFTFDFQSVTAWSYFFIYDMHSLRLVYGKVCFQKTRPNKTKQNKNKKTEVKTKQKKNKTEQFKKKQSKQRKAKE